MINFLKLSSINKKYNEDFLRSLDNILTTGKYLFGEQVEMFENEFANFCGVRGCIGVANGLDALTITFRTWIELGLIDEGNEVIVPGNSFIASALAIEQANLIPKFVEPDSKTYNICAEQIERAIGSNTKAIMPVHLYGLLCDMGEIMQLAKKHNLLVVEDCAQAHGANTAGVFSGAAGNAGAFSFYPGKNLGGITDGGAIISNDWKFLNVARQIANYGAGTKYKHLYKGQNSRLNEINAAFLRHKLKDIETELSYRRNQARMYLDCINNKLVEIKLRETDNFNFASHAFHLFVVETHNRFCLQKHLLAHNIETGIHYPLPIYRQKAFCEYNPEFPTTSDTLTNRVLSLPIGSHLEQDQISIICETVNSYDGS